MVFFFQAEDGIRDIGVTGVQTCALPICDLFGALNKQGKGIEESPVSAENLGGLIDLIADNTISGRIAKDVFAEMVETGKPAAVIVEEKGLRQVTDTGAIDSAIAGVLAANPDKVAEYRGGKEK